MIHLTTLIACGSVTVNNQRWIGNEGPAGATWFDTLDASTGHWDATTWLAYLERNPLICTDPKTFGDAKRAVEQLCSICGCCSYQTQAAISAFMDHVSQIKVGK